MSRIKSGSHSLSESADKLRKKKPLQTLSRAKERIPTLNFETENTSTLPSSSETEEEEEEADSVVSEEEEGEDEEEEEDEDEDEDEEEEEEGADDEEAEEDDEEDGDDDEEQVEEEEVDLPEQKSQHRVIRSTKLAAEQDESEASGDESGDEESTEVEGEEDDDEEEDEEEDQEEVDGEVKDGGEEEKGKGEMVGEVDPTPNDKRGENKREEKIATKQVTPTRTDDKSAKTNSQQPRTSRRNSSPLKRTPSRDASSSPSTGQQLYSPSVDILANNLANTRIHTRESLAQNEPTVKETIEGRIDAIGSGEAKTAELNDKSGIEDKNPITIFRKERDEYRKKLKEDPSFTPIVGKFWGHDDRCFTEGLKRESQFRRRRVEYREKSHTLFNPELAGIVKWDHSGFEELLRLEERDAKIREGERASRSKGPQRRPNRRVSLSNRPQENHNRRELKTQVNDETNEVSGEKSKGNTEEEPNVESEVKTNSIDENNTHPPKRVEPSKPLVRPPNNFPTGKELWQNESDATSSKHQVELVSQDQQKPNKDPTSLDANRITPGSSDKASPYVPEIENGAGNGGGVIQGAEIMAEENKSPEIAQQVHDTAGKSKRYSSRRPQASASKASTIPIKAINAPEFQPRRFVPATTPQTQSIDDTALKSDQVASNISHDPSNGPHNGTSTSNYPLTQYPNRVSNTPRTFGSAPPRRAPFAPTLEQNDRNVHDENKNNNINGGKKPFVPIYPSHVTTGAEYQAAMVPTAMMGNGSPMPYAPPGYMLVPQYGYPGVIPPIYGMQHEEPTYGPPYAYFSSGMASPAVYPATTHATYNHGGGTVYYSNATDERGVAVPAGEPPKYVPMYQEYAPTGPIMTTSAVDGPPGYFYSPQPYWHPGMEGGSESVHHTG